MSNPWDKWFPGVLCREQIQSLFVSGHIKSEEDSPKIDAAAIDLSVSDHAWRMKRGSIKPRERYHYILDDSDLAEKFPYDGEGVYKLDAKKTYVFKLREKVYFENTHLYGEATAKSSVGRVDVLARLIASGMDRYESFTPCTTDLFLEVTPITFPVKVKVGSALSQLRLFYGRPSISKIETKDEFDLYPRLMYDCPWPPKNADPMLSVNLSAYRIGNFDGACAFVARKADADKQDGYIALWKEKDRSSPCKHWSILAHDARDLMTLEAGRFYILRSKERLILPKSIAAYCRAIDETIGEMRIHYAGFVHPSFGENRSDNATGTPLIFEVRGHDVDVTLHDGEKMARVEFYRMSQRAEEDKTDYNQQELKLSTFFDDWPNRICVDESGNVTDDGKD